MQNHRGVALVIGSLLLAQLSGCATPAKPQAMTVQPTQINVPAGDALKGKLKIGEISGGKSTNPLWTSQVDNAAFKTALQDSLAIAGYTASNPADAEYEVKANLVSLDQPLFGLTLDVKSNVSYQLTGPDVQKTFAINAIGTAGPGDAFVAVQRLRMANERSIMENIKSFIGELGKLRP